MPSESTLSDAVERFISTLKRGHLQGSYAVAKNTVLLMRMCVSHSRWNNAKELMDKVRDVGKFIIAAQPNETAVGCIVRRALHIIREEHASCQSNAPADEVAPTLSTSLSLHTMLTAPDSDPLDLSAFSHRLKPLVVEALGELLDEIESTTANIASQALEHIHSDEVIMTFGRSKTVEQFLIEAGRKRKFHVIVAEAAPFCYGQELAAKIAAAGIQTTVIPDSAVFAMMARVHKVIIGTHTVIADGGLIALNGAHALAMAAKHHSVPVLVCAGIFKLSPQFLCSYDQDSFNNLVAPSDVLPFSEGELVAHVRVYNPVFDYVPADLVTLIISNIGGYAPSYVYRLLSDHYHPQDYEL